MRCDNLKKNAFDIICRLKKNGFTAFIAGGAVRDMVMGIEPKDYDIVTDAPVEKVAEIFERNFLKCPVFKSTDEVAQPHVVLRYNAGSLNSRKSMVTPYLPRIVT